MPSGSQRGPVSQAALAGDRAAPAARGHVHDWICDVSRSGSRCEVTAIARPSGDQTNSSTSTPGAVIGVGSGERGRVAGRPRRGTGASTSQS